MSAKKENINSEKTSAKTSGERYLYAVGRRKTAVAQVFLYAENKSKEDSVVNKKSIKEYFPLSTLQNTLYAPLKAVGLDEKARVSVLVRGGGKHGQAEASRLGIARALVKLDEGFRKTLKGLGYLTRDPREVERKKPGLKKARRAPQWRKR